MLESAEEVFGDERARLLQLEEEQRAHADDDQVQVVALEDRFVLGPRGGARVRNDGRAVGTPGGPDQGDETQCRADGGVDVDLAGEFDSQAGTAGEPLEGGRIAEEGDRLAGDDRSHAHGQGDEQ